KSLGSHPGDFPDWVDAALADEEPFAFEPVEPVSPQEAKSPAPGGSDSHRCDGLSAGSVENPPAAAATPAPAQDAPKQLLKEAAEECIAEHESRGAWSRDSVEQVRAAIRL